MADEELEKDGEGAGEKKGGFPKIIIFIGAGVLLVTVLAFVAVKFFIAPSAKETQVDAPTETVQPEEKKFGELFSFNQAVIVNLAETNGQRYLKVNLQFEMSESDLKQELEARTPQILDLVIAILSSKTIEDVTTVVGRNRLKREILDKSNAELVTGKVVNIYFTEFVIQ